MASESKMDHTSQSQPADPFYDLPPESFSVSTADEQDWYDRYAVMQRKTSLKLGFNRNNKSLIPNGHRSDTNRKSSPLLGLAKGRKSFGPERNPPEKKTSSRPLFRSRSEPGGKKPPSPTVQVSDPGSPRVSCTGRIGVKTRSPADGTVNKNGFSKLFGSLFGSGAGRTRSRKG